MLIECFGVPGCGKTELVMELARAFGKKKIRCRLASTARLQAAPSPFMRALAALTKATRCLAETLTAPTRTCGLICCIAATGPRSCFAAAKGLVNHLEVSWLLRCHGRSRALVLFDQGICQGLWSIGWSARTLSLGNLQRFQRLLPRPALVIDVEVEPEILAERLRQRTEAHSRLDMADRTDATAIDRAFQLCAQIRATLKDHAPTRVLCVCNNGDRTKLRETADRIAGAIAKGRIGSV